MTPVAGKRVFTGLGVVELFKGTPARAWKAPAPPPAGFHSSTASTEACVRTVCDAGSRAGLPYIFSNITRRYTHTVLCYQLLSSVVVAGKELEVHYTRKTQRRPELAGLEGTRP